MDDAEDEEDVVVGDEVVHEAIVAYAKAVEGVSPAADRLDLLAADAAGLGGGLGELFEVVADPRLQRSRQLLIGTLGSRGEPDLVAIAQAMSWSGLLRPRRYASRARRRMLMNSSALASTRSSASSTGIKTAVGWPRLVIT